MPDRVPIRLHYEDAQYVDASDLNAEQQYHDSQLREHNTLQHTRGVIRGLEIIFSEDDGHYVVSEGVALNGRGEVLRFLPAPIPSEIFITRGDNRLWVYVSPGRDMAAGTGAHAIGTCDGNGTRYPRRTTSEPALLIESVRRPDHDDTSSRLVFIGTIFYDPLLYPNQPYQTDSSIRHNAGLVGQRIVAPSGAATVSIGPSSGNSQEKNRLFSVSTHSTNATGFNGQPSQADVKHPFAIEKDKIAMLETFVDGDLTMERGRVVFAKPVASQHPAGHEPGFAVYLRTEKRESKLALANCMTNPENEREPQQRKTNRQADPGTSTAKKNGFDHTSMVFEIPSDAAGFEIGYHDGEAFKPIVSVTRSGMLVDGNLTVTGGLTDQGREECQLGDDAKNLIFSGFLSAAQAPDLIEAFRRNVLFDVSSLISNSLETLSGRQFILDTLGKNDIARRQFAKEILNLATENNSLLDEMIEAIKPEEGNDSEVSSKTIESLAKAILSYERTE